MSDDIWTFRIPSGKSVHREMAVVLEAGGPWSRVGDLPFAPKPRLSLQLLKPHFLFGRNWEKLQDEGEEGSQNPS